MPPNYGQPWRPQVNFDALSEAFQLFSREAGTWLLVELIFFGILMALGLSFFLVFLPLGLVPWGKGGEWAGGALFFLMLFGWVTVIMLVTTTLMAAQYRMALKQVRGEPIQFSDAFSFGGNLGGLVAVSLLVSLCTMLGLAFCYIPGMIIAGLLMFSVPLVIDKGLSPIEAMKLSWNTLSGDTLMATVLHFVVALLAGLFSPFTWPFMVLTVSVLYRNFFIPAPLSQFGGYQQWGAPPYMPYAGTNYPPPPAGGYPPPTQAAYPPPPPAPEQPLPPNPPHPQ